jgi:hypothetical protein
MRISSVDIYLLHGNASNLDELRLALTRSTFLVARISIKKRRTNLAAEKMSLRSIGLSQETAIVSTLFTKISVKTFKRAPPILPINRNIGR